MNSFHYRHEINNKVMKLTRKTFVQQFTPQGSINTATKEIRNDSSVTNSCC